MDPDIEWQIGEEAAPELVVTTPSKRQVRRSSLLITFIIVLGVSLGWAYRSLPEILPRLVPPALPPIPVDLYETIEQEAQDLADNTISTSVEAWGRPSTGPLYTILDFGLSTPTEAWVDIRQFRQGQFFRVTRFYSKTHEQWQRDYAHAWFWSGQVETLDTPHLHFIYPVEDRALIPPLAQQLEEIYTTLCTDLGCDLIHPAITFTLRLTKPDGKEDVFKNDLLESFTPRVMGIFEGERSIQTGNSDLVRSLIRATVQRVAYGRRFKEGGGRIVIDVAIDEISQWAIERALDLKSEPIQKS